MVTSETWKSYWKLGAFVLAVTAVRLAAAAIIPLSEDEAYYRLWAQHLRFGYFDHPPMVAWWISAGQALAGPTPLGVRLLPVLGAGVASILVAAIARDLGASPTTAFRASVWYNATTTIGVGGILATPDAPATLFWVLVLWALGRIRAGHRPQWWLIAGLAAGLACISKYSALFLAPGVFLWLISSANGWKALRNPWPWLAVLIAGAVFSTNVMWNAQHHWLTMEKQFGRVAPEGLNPKHLVDFAMTQIFLLNPLIAMLAARAIPIAWKDRSGPLALPLLTSLPFAAYLLIHALHDRVQAHWPVPLFAGLVIAAAMLSEQDSQSVRAKALRALAIGSGYLVSLGLLAFIAFGSLPALGRKDPVLTLRDWPAFARQIEARRQHVGAGWIGTVAYGTAAQLANTEVIGAPLLQVIERDRYLDPEPRRPDQSQPGLIVDLDRRVEAKDLATCFAHVEALSQVIRGASAKHGVRYDVFLVSSPKVNLIDSGCPNDLGKKPRK
jgi:4-amino-4-deoxy-L-arabinose transferase-like glycosyltransferase